MKRLQQINHRQIPLAFFVILTICTTSLASISLEPSIATKEVSISQITVDEFTYDILSIEEYPKYPSIMEFSSPCIPSKLHHFLLPSNQQIDEIEIVSMEWDTLPGNYFLYPVQNTSMDSTFFSYPDPLIYESSSPWPDSPIEIVSQGGMMGVGVVTVLVTPVRYLPTDSLLLTLSQITVSLDMGISQFDVTVPVSETSWSLTNRIQGILASVENPSDYKGYSTTDSRRDGADSYGPLLITDIPSANGDGVDFVIITTNALENDWQTLADIRIKQGIITVVRTVEWIQSEYSGCDTQEQMKNFITDAYEYWGTSMVLLGGDHEIVPSRICVETVWDGGYPCDGYYSDVDEDGEDWNEYGYWQQPAKDIFMEINVGRVPVNNSDMVQTFLTKLEIYENPTSLPYGFGRSALFIGDSNSSSGDGWGAEDCETLNQDLISAGIAGSSGKYLDPVKELYWPRWDLINGLWNGDMLSRNTALDAIDDGYNFIIHVAHSGSHSLGAQSAESLPARQYITEGDIYNLTNTNMPSILFSMGCWPGHFQGTECIIERGLFSSNTTGLIAGMVFARSGHWWCTPNFIEPLANALYGYKTYAQIGSELKPYIYLGASYKHMLNAIDVTTDEYYMNLLGDPTMFVWRGNAMRPTVTANPSVVTAGVFSTTVHASEMGIALPGATVCLYKEDELFAIGITDSNGDAIFSNVQVASLGTINVTVTKRRGTNGIVHYLPSTTDITVQQATQAMINLESLNIDDDNTLGSFGNDDGEVNPGETVKFDLVVNNNGQNTATNANVTLSIVSGTDQIETQIDMSENLGSVTPGTSSYTGAFALEINDDVPSGSDPVILSVSFSYDQGSRVDPADFRVLVGELELPIRTMTITQGNSQPVIINIDNLLVSNSGLGNLEGVEVEFTNPSGGVVFIDDLSQVLGDINNCSGEEVEDGIHAVLRNPSRCWNPITSDATFDLEISHRWGTETVTLNAYDILTQGTVQPPSSTTLEVLEADQESVTYEWGNSTASETGWYLWEQSGFGPWRRENTFPLDGSLRHGTIDGLTAGTAYNIGVSVIGEYGQESSIVSFETSTTCASVSGWPVYLDGSTGSGPAITDIDNDGNDEVIAATYAGSVYIIERDGTKTKIYDSSYLFSGVAIGDVLIGGRDEIVASGWNYDADTGKNGVIVVLKWTQVFGWTGTEIIANSDSDQKIHKILTVPVLFNADNSGNLEIAMRTFSAMYSISPGNLPYSWLYVWEFDNNQWSSMNGFPKVLSDGAWDYAAPVYIGDTDSDGYPELVVSNGTEALYWIEPETGQDADWDVSSSFPLTYQSTTLDWNLGQSYMVAVNDGGTCKIISVGRHNISFTAPPYYVTACINAENGGSGLWFSSVNRTSDSFGNLGGPAISDVDGDSNLEIANQWIESSTKLVEFLDLSNGFRTTLAGVPYNPQQEDIGMSPMIIAGDKGDGLAVFGGMSTVSHGSIFSSGSPELIAGSSYWSGDRIVSTPAVGNLDNDSDLEIVFSDDSGILYALDMNLSSSSSDWPTLQHDLQRTGYFNFSGKGSLDTALDLQLIGVSRDRVSSLALSSNQISVNVLIEGADNTNHSATELPITTQASSVSASISVRTHNNSALILETNDRIEITPPSETVKVSLFAGTTLLETKCIPMQNGAHAVDFNYPGNLWMGELTAVIDPLMEYQEIDEGNNILDLSGEVIESTRVNEIILNSSRNGVSLSIPAEILSGDQVTAMLYSIDGRIVARNSTEVDSAGSLSLDLRSETGSLPFGCYVVLLNDGDDLILRRKVLVIE